MSVQVCPGRGGAFQPRIRGAFKTLIGNGSVVIFAAVVTTIVWSVADSELGAVASTQSPPCPGCPVLFPRLPVDTEPAMPTVTLSPLPVGNRLTPVITRSTSGATVVGVTPVMRG